MKRLVQLLLATVCVLVTWPTLAARAQEDPTSPVATTRPSHGRPQRSEDGRLGGAGRAQAEGRARNRVGIKGTDRKYGAAGQLLESRDARGVTTYGYDSEGNLIEKVEPDASVWKYEWNGAGMLARVVRPNGHVVEFGYDPLARRTFKKYRGKTTKWIWDGNVPLHEWVERDADAVDEDFAREPQEDDAVAVAEKQLKAMLSGRPANGPPVDAASAKSFEAANACGTVDAPVTWVFEPESFAPLAKIVGGERFGVVTDHLGTPRAMFDGHGHEVWGADIDAYGDLRNVRGERQACPFRWPGQYEDEETGLYYNRFRYYSTDGEYIAQDPIGLMGGAAFYAYPLEPLSWIDPFGLSCTHHPSQAAARRAAEREAGMGRHGLREVLPDKPLHPGSQAPQGPRGLRTEVQSPETGRIVHHDPYGNHYPDDPSQTIGPHFGVEGPGIEGTSHHTYPTTHDPTTNR